MYPFERSDYCLQSDRECPVHARRAYNDCLICEGEVLAGEVTACDEREGQEARLACLGESLRRFSDRLDGCLLG